MDLRKQTVSHAIMMKPLCFHGYHMVQESGHSSLVAHTTFCVGAKVL